MCGIVGYIGDRQARDILIDSLKRLEYRGYDSAGIAVINTGKGKNSLKVQRAKGMIAELEKNLEESPGSLGISHTRWATHGKPSVVNAHPHTDPNEEVALIHNGIIENFLELRDRLTSQGHKFRSETDTEIIAHLISKYYKGNLEAAVKKAIKDLEGAFALVIIHKNEPEKLVCVRNRSPLIIGMGVNENFVASDVPAILKYTRKVIYLKDMEMGVLTRNKVDVLSLETSKPVPIEPKEIEWSLEDAQKGGYDHYMLKEIYEQPQSIHKALLVRVGNPSLERALSNGQLFDQIKIIACGTSYHAGLIGKYILERLLKFPVTVDLASEYRYSQATHERPLVILITQSGETADTIAAAREAKRRNCLTLGLTNVVGSTITREVDEVLYIKAGPEISVAATKSYTSQLILLYLLAIYIGEVRGILKPSEVKILNEDLRTMPRAVEKVLTRAPEIEKCAKDIAKAQNIFFIGRNINYPTALEGALKLKEISYIHAEGYPAGELKHGPISLLEEKTPVVAISLRDEVFDKMQSNIQEVAARNAPVLGIVTEGEDLLLDYLDWVIQIPKTPSLFSPVPTSVALQLLAYYTAKERGCPIDNPRNLAKSVTVE
jgi:glucosamine--fructose-6-phosphate aminotransferase (isomerizing)